MAGFDLLGGRPAPASAAPEAASSDASVIDVTTQTFMADVIEASKTMLVLVDFWAEWCGPCRQLTPVLEKAVAAANGAVRLARMNIDTDPEVAGQLGVQSLPAVFAFKDGRPVDTFMGALPESEVKAFIEKHAGTGAVAGGPGDIENALGALEAGDIAGASNLLSEILGNDPANIEALAGMARCMLANGDAEGAETTLDMIPAADQASGSVSAVRAMLDLARKSATVGDTAPLQAKVDAAPDDHQARYDLAIALGTAGDKEAAVDALLEIMRRKHDWNEDAARIQLVEFFDAWGVGDPAAIAGRKRLSALLFS